MNCEVGEQLNYNSLAGRTDEASVAREGAHPTTARGLDMSRPNDLLQGTLDLLVLKILALEPMHGWAISQRLKQMSGEVLQVSDGSLYPALLNWSTKAGSKPTGRPPKAIAGQNSTS